MRRAEYVDFKYSFVKEGNTAGTIDLRYKRKSTGRWVHQAFGEKQARHISQCNCLLSVEVMAAQSLPEERCRNTNYVCHTNLVVLHIYMTLCTSKALFQI